MVNNRKIIIIPAYNPDFKLVSLVHDLSELNEFQIIVVNDGSFTEKQIVFDLISPYVVLLKHNQNTGKGSAIKTALKYIENHNDSFTVITTMDADGQHIVDDVVKVCESALIYPNSLILGSRKFDKSTPLKSYMGNKITKFIFRCISGKSISDTQTGLRAFNSKFIPLLLSIEGDRYEYEMNMLLRFCKEEIPIKEIEIKTIYRDKENSTSHFNIIKDSIKIYSTLFKYVGSSFVSFIVDYISFIVIMLFTNQLIFSNVSARVISATVNYNLNRKYVFNSTGHLIESLSKYALLCIFILIMNSIILDLLSINLHIPEFIAKIMTEMILFFISLIVQKIYIFKDAKVR